MSDQELGKKQEVDPKSIEFVTTPVDAPTIHIDGMQGILSSAGTIKISFYEDTLDTNAQKAKRRHVVTLAMSEQAFKEIAGYLSKTLEQDFGSGGTK